MSKLVFVTGAAGYIASHIIHELLRKGYRVRGSARGFKLTNLRQQYASVAEVEFVEIKDVATDRFPLEGIDAVTHTASPLPVAIDGNLNILQQGEAAGVRNFVVTSSFATLARDPTVKGQAYRDYRELEPLTKDSALTTNNNFLIYQASKKCAELATWKWAENHPEVDVTTLNPPFIYGPLSPTYKPAKQGRIFSAISTASLIYNLLNPNGTYPPSPGYSDIRDVACSHVGALSTPTSVKGRKRVAIASPYDFDYREVVELIGRERPALAGRLITLPPPVLEFTKYDIDYHRHKEVTGMGGGEDFHAGEQTVLDTVEYLIDLENEWKL